MKKVGIDARLILGQRRGMGNVLYNILMKIKNYYDSDIVLYFDREVDSEMKQKLLAMKFEIKVIPNTNYIVWEQISLPGNMDEDLDIFWFPYNTGTLKMKKGIKKLVSIHDIMFMKSSKVLPYSKSIYQNVGRLYRKFITPKVAKSSDRIITISDFSKKDIVSEISNVDEKIEVVYNGCETIEVSEKDRLEFESFKLENMIPEEYLLCLGAIDPRKNTIYTIESFAEFIKKNALDDMKLVVCGLNNWEGSIYHEKAKELGVEKNVVFLGYVSDKTLRMLYIKAKIFLFLSYYEGFGLPILEAMDSETPVITTNMTSMPEIAGDAAVITSYNEVADTVRDIEKIYYDKKMYEELVAAGKERVRLFTWDKVSERISEILKEM